jgi:hypothetical protein
LVIRKRHLANVSRIGLGMEMLAIAKEIRHGEIKWSEKEIGNYGFEQNVA